MARADAFEGLTTGSVDGDAVADIILAARGGDGPAEGRTNAGEAYIVFGRQSPAPFPAVFDMAGTAGVGPNVRIYGGSANDQPTGIVSGPSVSVGDVNGDGLEDILLRAVNADGFGETRLNAGEGYVIFGTTSGPAVAEIAVEQPITAEILDGGSKVFNPVPTGSSNTRTFTLRNTGRADLTGLEITFDGPHAAMFSVTAAPSAPLPGPSMTTFTVRFAPTSDGMKTAALHIANNDADENPFDINLSGLALSFTQDTDGDGLNDASEFHMSPFGFDWQVSQPALVSTLFTHANGAGLFTTTQVQALHIDFPLLARDPGTGEFTLTIGVQKATDLTDFDPFPMTAPQTLINAAGKLEFRFTSPDNAAFFRLDAR